MPRVHAPENVINGSYGEIWIDDDYYAAVQSFEINVEMTKGDVKYPRDLWGYKKVTELAGTGSVTLQKVTSSGYNLMHNKISQGKTPVFKILAKLADPDAFGVERIMVKNVTFNSMPLMNFSHAELGEETLDFDFAGYEVYDSIE